MEGKKFPIRETTRFKEIQKYMEQRNELAHELTRIDDINSNSILKTIKYLMMTTFGNKIKTESFDLYDNINKKIIQSL